MSRKIYVSDSMGLDEALVKISSWPGGATAVMLWPWVLLSLDDWGRGSANPAIIKAKVAPAFDSITREMFASAIDLYVEAGILMRYEVDRSTIVAAIPSSWWRYQTHVAREKRMADGSRFAPPPDNYTKPLSGSGIARDSAETREIPRDPAENCSSLSLSLSLSPSPSPSPSYAAPTISRTRKLPAGKAPDGQAVRQHPNAPFMAVFDAEFGAARTPAETKRRALAANDLRAGNATTEEVQRAIRQWPSVYPGATCTPHAIANNFGSLIGPIRRRAEGTVDATMAWLTGGLDGGYEGGVRGGDEPFVGGVSTGEDDVRRGQAGGSSDVLGSDRAVIVVDGRLAR